MKSLTILGIFLSISFHSFGQIFNPVKWQIEPNSISEGELELIFTAKIDKDWYIYSQQTHKDGPIPTTFYFNQGNHYELVGATKEIGDLKTVAENDRNELLISMVRGILAKAKIHQERIVAYFRASRTSSSGSS